MNNQEAIETIKIAAAEVEWEYPLDYQIAFEKSIKALEKQIPVKPVKVKPVNDLARWRLKCPKCGGIVGEKEEVILFELCKIREVKYDYCPNCGQKIDWSKE